MGMFDKIEQLKNADFADGDFIVYGGTYNGLVEHPEYGRNHQAEVFAGPTNGKEDTAEKYVVYGVMAEQIGRMTGSDLPATVRIGKDGRANIFVKVS